MRKIDLRRTYLSILNCFKNEDYNGVIRNFEHYLSLKDAGLMETLMLYYAVSLERLGFHEEAIRAYKIKNQFYDGINTRLSMINLLYYSAEIEQGKKEVKDLMAKDPENAYYYYLLAKFYLLNNEIIDAKKYFNEALKKNNIEKYQLVIQKYLDLITKKEKEGLFLRMGYNAFLESGYKLEPGYIINIKKPLQYLNKKDLNQDPKSTRRPYLIWKVENNYVYALQVTTKVNYMLDHVISSSKYLNLDMEATCKDNICVINKQDISCVVEKIDDNDLVALLLCTYDEIMHLPISEKRKRSCFIKEVHEYLKHQRKAIKHYQKVKKK